jgi:hypothetical protein
MIINDDGSFIRISYKIGTDYIEWSFSLLYDARSPAASTG